MYVEMGNAGLWEYRIYFTEACSDGISKKNLDVAQSTKENGPGDQETRVSLVSLAFIA